MRLQLVTIFAMLLPPFLSGCACLPPQPQAYFGATLSMDQVVQEINLNNGAIPSLSATHNFAAKVFDDKGAAHEFSGDGTLCFRRDRDLLFIGQAPGMDIFEIGSNRERYWVKVVPQIDTFWHGRYDRIDRLAPDRIPVRPDLILEVLGVGRIDTNFLAAPVPTMRFNNEEAAYQFLWSVSLGDRWVPVKEIWYDVATKLPRKVILYAPDGRILVRANLWGPLDVAPDPNAPPGADICVPHINRHFDLFFPDTKSLMRLDLTSARVRNAAGAPNDRTFRFPKESGAGRQIDLDAPDDAGH